MLKLFFRNKAVEIGNWLYNKRYLLRFIAVIIFIITVATLIIIGVDYAGKHYPDQTNIVCVSLIALFVMTLITRSVYRFLHNNYQLAKQGIKVQKAWGGNKRILQLINVIYLETESSSLQKDIINHPFFTLLREEGQSSIPCLIDCLNNDRYKLIALLLLNYIVNKPDRINMNGKIDDMCNYWKEWYTIRTKPLY